MENIYRYHNLTRCPACRFTGQPTPAPGYKPDGHRCEVCKGHGLASPMQVMGWELSL